MIVCVKLSTAPSPDNQYQQNDDMDEEELCQVEDPLGTSLSDIHPEVSLSTGSPMCEDIRERQTYNSELPIRNPQKRSRTSTSTYDPYSFSDNEENETIINNKHVDILGTSLQELQAQDNNQLKKLKESVDIPSTPLTEHQTDYNQQDQQLEGSEDILGSSLAELHSNDNKQSGAMSFSFTIEDILYANKKRKKAVQKTNSFSRCQTCTTLTTRLEKTRDQAEREAIKKKHNGAQFQTDQKKCKMAITTFAKEDKQPPASCCKLTSTNSRNDRQRNR
ncbi:Hypothetical predicted protein [Mytilus galloprovincialis]|uniref:Uncharacterized protein n=1 Tax=Mytilus galloprovincialis TaxID=29158 RepID=A0A8B6GWF4_MYTGA|nr:Hypothetical predicted protein [Mytilus galloprovincialis]